MYDTTTQAKAFKDYIAPGVVAEIKARSKIYERIQKSDKLILGGHTAKQKVLIRASQASRAGNSDAYPTPAESTPEEVTVVLKRAQMFSLQWSGFALEAAAKGGAVQDPVIFEKTGIVMTLRDDMSRQLLWDGSGRLCQAKGLGSTTATLVVDSPYLLTEPTKFLKNGRIIDAYDPADDSHDIDSIAILTKDSPTQVTLATTQSWADDSWIYNEDTWRKTEAVSLGEMMGLLGICSDADPPTGALQGLDVAGYPEWKAAVKTSDSMRPFSEDLLISALDEASEWGDPTFALITKKIRRVYRAYLSGLKVFGDQSKIMWGGWVGLPFLYDGKEIPLVPDNFVPDGHIIGGDEKKLTIYLTSAGKDGDEVTWEVGDSGKIMQKVAGYNRFTAEGHIFANMGVSVRASFFKIDKIEEPTA